MALFKPKTPCKIYRKGVTNIYGEQTLSLPTATKCAVVKLMRGKQDSTVRTDSGATRGHADELIAEAKLLFAVSDDVKPGDVLEVNGVRVIADRVAFQYTVGGKLDHLQVVGSIE